MYFFIIIQNFFTNIGMSSPCRNNGSCESGSNDSFYCNCPQNYFGQICQYKFDYCQSNSCVFGYCINQVFLYTQLGSKKN